MEAIPALDASVVVVDFREKTIAQHRGLVSPSSVARGRGKNLAESFQVRRRAAVAQHTPRGGLHFGFATDRLVLGIGLEQIFSEHVAAVRHWHQPGPP